MFGCGHKFAALEIVPGIAGVDGGKLEDTWVAVAINHATSAAIANQLRLVELIDIAHRRFPKVTAIEIEVPVEIKIFMAAQATELFRLAAQMALHFVERFGRIDDREAAASFHLLDFFKH